MPSKHCDVFTNTHFFLCVIHNTATLQHLVLKFQLTHAQTVCTRLLLRAWIWGYDTPMTWSCRWQWSSLKWPLKQGFGFQCSTVLHPHMCIYINLIWNGQHQKYFHERVLHVFLGFTTSTMIHAKFPFYRWVHVEHGASFLRECGPNVCLHCTCTCICVYTHTK